MSGSQARFCSGYCRPADQQDHRDPACCCGILRTTLVSCMVEIQIQRVIKGFIGTTSRIAISESSVPGYSPTAAAIFASHGGVAPLIPTDESITPDEVAGDKPAADIQQALLIRGDFCLGRLPGTPQKNAILEDARFSDTAFATRVL